MGLSNSTSSKVYVKLKADVADKTVAFVTSKKENGDWVEADRYTNFDGKLVGFKFDSYEWKKKTYTKIEMTFVSDGETYVVSTNMSTLGKNLINSLSSREDLFGLSVSLSVWGAEKNGNWNANIAVRTGEEKIGWKYTWDELTKLFGKKYGAEWFKSEELWVNMAEKFITPQFEGKTFSIEDAPQVPIYVEEDDSEDLPF